MQSVRVATYNIHKCRGIDGRLSPARILQVLSEMRPDVIGLQEVLSIDGGPRELDQARFLAEEMGMHLSIGENRRLDGGSYGNVVLSRFPIRGECNHDVSVAGYEPRGCMSANIDLPGGRELHLFNVHFGTGFLERRRQAQLVVERSLLKAADAPRVVLGDFNEWTAGHLTQTLQREFRGADIRLNLRWRRSYPGWLPFLHLDHIYYDSSLLLESVRLHRTPVSLVASDHVPIVADFRLAPPSRDEPVR